MPSHVAELLLGLGVGEPLGVDPADLDSPPCWAPAWLSASITDRYASSSFVYLPTSPIRTGVEAESMLLDEPSQSVRSGAGRLHAEVAEDLVVDALGAEVERHLVDRVDVARRDHGLDRQVREQRDLLADVAAERLLGAAHDHVRLDADAAQLLDRVLGGLGLELAGVAEERHQGEVQEHAAVAALVDLELAQRLEERQRLDVADRAADLRDHDVDVGGLGHQPDAVLDLVGDVRDHLDGVAEVVAAALAPDHRVVDRAGRGVGGRAWR